MRVKVFYPFTLLRKHFESLEDIETSLKKLEPFYYFRKYEKSRGLYCFEARIADSFIKNIYLEVTSSTVVRMVLEFDTSLFDSEDMELLKQRVLSMVRTKDYEVVFDGNKVSCSYRHEVGYETSLESAFEVLDLVERQVVTLLKEKGLYNKNMEVER